MQRPAENHVFEINGLINLRYETLDRPEGGAHQLIFEKKK